MPRLEIVWLQRLSMMLLAAPSPQERATPAWHARLAGLLFNMYAAIQQKVRGRGGPASEGISLGRTGCGERRALVIRHPSNQQVCAHLPHTNLQDRRVAVLRGVLEAMSLLLEPEVWGLAGGVGQRGGMQRSWVGQLWQPADR